MPGNHINLAVVFAISSLLGGCGSQSFRYTVSEPIRLEPLDNQNSEKVFTAEGYGFIWSDCRTVNADAVDDLLGDAESKGYEAVADLKWYDYEKQKWLKEPTCRTEYGWLAGTLYTFWWPKATKVRVQARGINKAVSADSSSKDIFKSKTLGEKEVLSSKSRKIHPNDTTLGLELMAGIPVLGAGVRAGHFFDADKRWGTNFELAIPVGEHLSCGSYVSGWATLATRFEHFLGNSFYYGIGPGIGYQRYLSSCQNSYSSDDVSSTRTSGRWSYGLVGIDVGLGNEWRSNSGLFGGCEWFGGFFGMPVVKNGEEVKDGTRMPLPFAPRILACYLGTAF